MEETTFGPVREIFRALARTIVPDAEKLDDPAWVEFENLIEQGVSSRPSKIRRQLRLFVKALNILPLFRFGKTFRSLDPAKRTSFLQSIEDSPLLIIRRGFWGVRTLVYMGYYGRGDARKAIGYTASPDGWEARR